MTGWARVPGGRVQHYWTPMPLPRWLRPLCGRVPPDEDIYLRQAPDAPRCSACEERLARHRMPLFEEEP